ncbi:MAG TPA: histidine kinase [Longimicrobiales bacterium]|nr:histidine kinase [Longimicrobiales bacterium]
MKQRSRSVLRYTLLSIGIATLLGLIEATQVHLATSKANPLSWSRSFTTTMPSWFVLAALVPFVILVARKYSLDRIREPQALIVHAFAASLFALAFLALSGWLSDYVLYQYPPGKAVPFLKNLRRLMGWYFTGQLMVYAGIVGGYFAYDYSRRYREKERAAAELALKASRLEVSLSRANLEALRMQLNPHFLFNTLNTVSVLALKGERQRVARMLSRLSDLLRLSLENDRQTLSLKEEIDFLERYLEIEQVRFKDRLSVAITVEEAAYEATVPSLILQPIVENALKYGFAQTIGPGNVSIVCRVKGNMLDLEVMDTGPGFPECRVQSTSTGVGIPNTRARLEQLYGANYTMEFNNRPEGGALVRIRIPYIRVPSPAEQDERMVARQA